MIVSPPLVSVILPVHDRVGSIAQAIRAVLDQTCASLELIVIDDGSTDGTAAVLATFGNQIRLIRQAAAGAYVARNAGLAVARGDLIAFADSDDVWYPNKLARQVPLFDDPTVGLVFGDVRHVDLAGIPLGRTSFQRSPPARGEVLARLADANFAPTTTVVVRRNCLIEIGGFEVTQRISADYLAWFRIAERHRFEYVPQAVADYAVHTGGISADLGRSLVARIALFSGYREAQLDDRIRSILAWLLVQLAVSLIIAWVRGRTRSAEYPVQKGIEVIKNLPSIDISIGIIKYAVKKLKYIIKSAAKNNKNFMIL